jgi:hypothetical protein
LCNISHKYASNFIDFPDFPDSLGFRNFLNYFSAMIPSRRNCCEIPKSEPNFGVVVLWGLQQAFCILRRRRRVNSRGLPPFFTPLSNCFGSFGC